jgi:hypothetical protein
VRRIISRHVSGTIASWRGTLEFLGVRLDLRAVGSRTSGQAAKEEEVLFCLSALQERHEDRALSRYATARNYATMISAMLQQRVGVVWQGRDATRRSSWLRLTNAHLRNVQPSFQQDIACRLRDVAVSTHMSLKNRSARARTMINVSEFSRSR